MIFDDLVYDLSQQAGEDRDPFRAELAKPGIWTDWTDIIPPPSLNEVLEEISNGDWNRVTQAQRMLQAEAVLRRISAREDTQLDLTKVEGGEQ